MNNVNMRFVIPFLAALSLTACKAGMQLDGSRTLFSRLPGSEFILHINIVIPPSQLRAGFQGGKLSYGVSEFEPRCELELRNFSEEPQTIHAGTYRIETVFGLDRYVLRPDESVLVAAAGVLQLVSDGDSQWYMHTYHMKLQSDVYENTPTLICGGAYNYAFYVQYPDLQDMLVALGDYAVINLRP